MPRDPSKCDQRVFDWGHYVAYASCRKSADQYCDELEKKEGGLADWHTSGGRYLVLHLPAVKVRFLDLMQKIIEGLTEEQLQEAIPELERIAR